VQASTAVPELRPLSIGEVLDVAIKIYWRHALTFFGVVLVVVAPIQLITSVVQVSAATDDNLNSRDAWLYGTGIVVAFILGFAAGTLATGACFKAVADAYLGEQPDWRTSLAFALRRVHSLIWVTVLVGVIAAVGLVFCIVPGIWLYISFAVAVPVLLTEGVKGRSALGRSRQLVKGRWWPTFGIVLLGTILAVIVSGVITGILAATSLSDPSNEILGVVTGTIGGTLSSMLTTPFQAAFITVLYFDLRVRKEGFDLQLLAERIGLAPRPEGELRPAPSFRPAPLPPPGGDQPPYWPPPPGWRPSSDEPGTG
jgi:hypothetical protein